VFYTTEHALESLILRLTQQSYLRWDRLEQHAQQPRKCSSKIMTFSSPAKNHAFGQTLRMAGSVGNLLPAAGSETSEDPTSDQMQLMTPWTSGTQSFAHNTPISSQTDDSMTWQATGASQPRGITTEQHVTINSPLVGVRPSLYAHERNFQSARLPDVNNASQPSNVRSVYKCFCELADWSTNRYTRYMRQGDGLRRVSS
jgi:hypothetical protein